MLKANLGRQLEICREALGRGVAANRFDQRFLPAEMHCRPPAHIAWKELWCAGIAPFPHYDPVLLAPTGGGLEPDNPQPKKA